MASNHRGQAIADPHANRINWEEPRKWGTIPGSTPGTPSRTHTGVDDYYEAEVYPEGGEHHIRVVHSSPYWRCEDGSCRDEKDLIGRNMTMSYRTPERAKNAAQALVNRHASGKTERYSNRLARRQYQSDMDDDY